MYQSRWKNWAAEVQYVNISNVQFWWSDIAIIYENTYEAGYVLVWVEKNKRCGQKTIVASMCMQMICKLQAHMQVLWMQMLYC